MGEGVNALSFPPSAICNRTGQKLDVDKLHNLKLKFFVKDQVVAL